MSSDLKERKNGLISMLHIQHTKYLNIIDYKFLVSCDICNMYSIFLIEH